MNIPNLISLLRLLLVPIIINLILTERFEHAFILFIIAGISDALDGFIARAFKCRTQLGAYLDPIADKALLMGVFLTLAYQGYIEIWVATIVIFRDILIIGGIILFSLLGKNIDMKPFFISKFNTFIQLLFIIFILGKGPFSFEGSHVHIYFGYIVAFTTTLSGIIYIRYGLCQLTQNEISTL